MYDVSTLVKGDLLLMINTAVPNNLKKENWIEDDTLLYHNIKMKKDFSITHPVFTLKTQDGIWKYNYIYYADTQRFYFVDDITPVIGGCVELICSVDTLMSFQQSIMNCPAFESRSSHIGSGYVADSKIIFNSAPKARTFMFKESNNKGLNFTGKSYVVGIANKGVYRTTLQQTDFDMPDFLELMNRKNPDAVGQVLDAFLNIYKAHFIRYHWGSHDTTNYYFDCAKFIDFVLHTIYPTMPVVGNYPSTGELGHFFYNMNQGQYTVDSSVTPNIKAECTIYSCTMSIDQIPDNSFIFLMARESADDDRATNYFPYGYPQAQKILGLRDEDGNIVNNRNANCGYGHAMYYAGHLMFDIRDNSYRQFNSLMMASGYFVDMGTGWCVHIVGEPDEEDVGKKPYVTWDETNHCPKNIDADGYVLLTQLQNNNRVAGIFKPTYPILRKYWGDGEDYNE